MLKCNFDTIKLNSLKMNGDIVINDGINNDRFIKFTANKN